MMRHSFLAAGETCKNVTILLDPQLELQLPRQHARVAFMQQAVEPMKRMTAQSPARSFCLRCAAVLGSYVVRLLSGCMDTALSASSAQQPTCLAARGVALCATLLHIKMEVERGPFEDHYPLHMALCGLPCSFGGQVAAGHRTPPKSAHAGQPTVMGIIEPSAGCPFCRVDSSILWPPVGLRFGLRGYLPACLGWLRSFVSCISCMQPLCRRLALPAGGFQNKAFFHSAGSVLAKVQSAQCCLTACDTDCSRPFCWEVLQASVALASDSTEPMRRKEGCTECRLLGAVRSVDWLRRPHGRGSVAWAQKVSAPSL